MKSDQDWVIVFVLHLIFLIFIRKNQTKIAMQCSIIEFDSIGSRDILQVSPTNRAIFVNALRLLLLF